jgi:hypothetical protein
MKIYSGIKTVDEIRAQCAEKNYPINTERHDESGWDHIVVTLPGPTGKPIEVLYNAFNGGFFHAPKDNPDNYFNSSDAGMDSKPWFVAMLDFFYKE